MLNLSKIIFLPVIITIMFAFSCSELKTQTLPEGEGWVSLFNGDSLTGWRKLSEYSGDKGKWDVNDGMIVGDQYPAGEGGLLVTNKKYRNFEVYLECKADYPIDSGLFLRVQPNVLSYQFTIDYRPDGEVGAIYSPNGGDFLFHNKKGAALWKKNEFNSVKVRIKDNPPHITAWLNGKKTVDYEDSLWGGKVRVPAEGFVGLQVHPGDSWGSGKKVYFKNIFIKEL
jgi:hypothetical protein